MRGETSNVHRLFQDVMGQRG